MIYIETYSTKPEMNLAYEQYFLESGAAGNEVFMLWRNEPTVVVGAFQNTIEEVDMSYAEEKNIQIVRRQSGGGAVYHDLGNLCYSFILNRKDYDDLDFSKLLRPVAAAIVKMGAPAKVSGRNDILIEGDKVSGSAVRVYQDRILFHGTLLFETDLNRLGKLLKGKKAESKAVKSVSSRVTNINQYLNIDMSAFTKQLLKSVLGSNIADVYQLSISDLQEVYNLAQFYKSPEWTFGKNPEMGLTYEKRFRDGTVSVHLNIAGQKIKECGFSGDFLGTMDIAEIEEALVGIEYTEEAIIKVLSQFDIQLYFGKIKYSEITAVILGKVY